jgi:hypothetical protein
VVNEDDPLDTARGFLNGLAISALLFLALFLLGGCSANSLRAIGLLSSSSGNSNSTGSPLARATDGASASFSLTSCRDGPPLGELIVQLNQQGIISLAEGPNTATRVTLNLCAGGGPLPAPPTPPARRPST